MKSVRIIADERERKSGIPTLLKEIGIDLEVRTLDIGDYIVAPETVVERKSIHDLLSSVFDGRLFSQCARLKEHFERPAVLMEGNIDELENITDNPMIFYGAVSTVILEFGIPIMPTPSAVHTAKMLVALATSTDRSTSRKPYLKRIRKSSNLEHQQLSILCSLPGVGEKFAERMLQKFGTPIGALSATSVELAKVEGMGEARAKKIRHVLNSKSPNKNDEEGQTKLGS